MALKKSKINIGGTLLNSHSRKKRYNSMGAELQMEKGTLTP
jgi:hypothetical protein